MNSRSNEGGVRQAHSSCHLLRAGIAILLAGTAIPLHAANSEAANQAAPQANTAPDQREQEIIVTGKSLFPDLRAERNLDETAIQSYGLSTIDELVGELQTELGSTDDPIIFVNGQRITDLSQIGALPVEAVRNLQVLPRGSGVRAGGGAGQRVISITLKRDVRSATVTAAHKVATEGHWNADRGEAILTHVHGDTRANLAFRVRDESRLLESDRNIIQPATDVPYAVGGNVIGYPDTTGEIDPLLSAAAGQIVTVAPIPTTATPTLADFAAHANGAALTDIGQFRSLRPMVRNYDLNGTFATRLAHWLTMNGTLDVTRDARRYQRGLPSALFVLQPTNPASPFSTTVGLAYYGDRPLIYRTRQDTGDANLTFDADWGSWNGTLNLRNTDFREVSHSDRQTGFGGPVPDTTNPFATGLGSTIAIQSDLATMRTVDNLMDMLVTGPLFTIPAGDVQTTYEGRLAWHSLRSHSTFSALENANIRQNEQAIRGQIVIPLTSRQNHVLGALGDLSLSAEYSLVHTSHVGSLENHTFGLNWDPSPTFHFEGELRKTELPPTVAVLGNPTIITPDVRVFDPLIGQTLDVTQIFGGNPNLRPESDKLRRLSGIIRLVPRLNLQANAEYSDLDRRNFISPLPAASVAVMLAFPDRFIRNSDGVLTTMDLRPVNFQSDREKALRWGLSMNTRLGGGAPPGTPGKTGPQNPNTYLQLTASHTIVFSDQIVIRPGLPSVDLLDGGAVGIASGRLRHQFDGTAGITSGGVGVRAGVTWRGRSSLLARINGESDRLDFSSLFTFNVRAFADARRVVPQAAWAKGLRLSLEVVNVTNAHQRVRDSFGNTPLDYQPAYRDPIGRTIEVEIRKVF